MGQHVTGARFKGGRTLDVRISRELNCNIVIDVRISRELNCNIAGVPFLYHPSLGNKYNILGDHMAIMFRKNMD